MLSIITAVIIGLIMGALVYVIDSLIHGRSLAVLGLDLVFGALGSYSGTYLVSYGPQLLGVDLLPTLAGGLVLSFVVTYAVRRFVLR
ncbi:hypothetical protein [Lacticaseibacillus kribbianus]|uniref:hypothetical protein n=1 Tax=Lacticaseibacillus kribbianus TaxID=2926292 RepID=UPI001CD5494B|nr:hypothetical protein [Lacticaseibacillus kribbianus]